MLPATNSLRDVQRSFTAALGGLYDSDEAVAIFSMVAERMLGLKRADVVAGARISESDINRLNVVLRRLKSNEPVHYILGEAPFMDMWLRVNSAVLIPRPETEELVDLIAKRNKSNGLKVLDVGTGSGCIAIGLTKRMNEAEVTGIDVSADALEVAIENLTISGTRVRFIHLDILNDELPLMDLDIIVSNPPYITRNEEKELVEHVRLSEPHLALFVPDNDPLIFYRAILNHASKSLKPNGKVYFECHHAFAADVAALCHEHEMADVELITDLQGHPRFVSACRAEF